MSQRNQHVAKRRTTIGCFSNEADARAASVEKALPRLNLIPNELRHKLLQFLERRPTKVSQSNNDDEPEDLVPAVLLDEALDQIEILQKQIRHSRKKPISPDEEESPSYNPAKTNIKLRYLLDGEAGEIEIDSNQKSIQMDTLLGVGCYQAKIAPTHNSKASLWWSVNSNLILVSSFIILPMRHCNSPAAVIWMYRHTPSPAWHVIGWVAQAKITDTHNSKASLW
eukprot:scaffold1335_cov47-Cyclotella_meneghiniana.AAC.1